MSHLLKQMVVLLLVSTVVVLPTYALDGGILIPTQTGHKAIKDIQVGDLVLSKNKTINQTNNPYPIFMPTNIVKQFI